MGLPPRDTPLLAFGSLNPVPGHSVLESIMEQREVVSLKQVRWLGVLSDTHGDVLNTRLAADVFRAYAVEAVVHCGDIGSEEIPAVLAAWPTHYVLGNVDRGCPELTSAVRAAGHTLHGRFAALTASGRRIAVLHSDNLDQFEAAIVSGDWDLICHGHTHQARQFQQRQTLVLNPGAVHRGLPPSVAIVDLESLQVSTIPLE